MYGKNTAKRPTVDFTIRLGLPDLLNKKVGCPFELEFQINSSVIFGIYFSEIQM